MIKLTDIKRPKTEDELFNILKNAIPSLIRTKERFNNIDAYSEEKNLAIELKSKNEHYNTMMILEDKYNQLQVYKNNRYVCATPEGIYSFNLKKLPKPIFQNEWLPCTTTSNVGSNDLCKKSTGYLPLTAATQIHA